MNQSEQIERALDSSARNIARGEDTRQRLIESAIEVFAEMVSRALARVSSPPAPCGVPRLSTKSAVVDLYELKLAVNL